MNDKFVVHDSTPPPIEDIVQMINAQSATVFREALSINPIKETSPVTWCEELISLIQGYNAHHRDNPFPVPSYTSLADPKTGRYETILTFRGNPALLRLAHFGVYNQSPEEKQAEDVSSEIKEAFAAINATDITKEGTSVRVGVNGSDAIHALEGKLMQYISHHPGALPVPRIEESVMECFIIFDNCTRDNLTELAGLGLKFPGHELHERLYKAEQATRGQNGPNLS